MVTVLSDAPSLEAATLAQSAKGKRIGAGMYRNVYYVAGSKWVYKVEANDQGANHQEYCNYLRYRDKLPEGIALPEMVMLSDSILAAEMIDGQHGHYGIDKCMCVPYGLTECWRDIVEPMEEKIFDIKADNIVISRKHGKVYLIDLGEYGNHAWGPYNRRQAQFFKAEGNKCICGCAKIYT